MPGPGSPVGGHTVESALAEAEYWRKRALARGSVGSLTVTSPYAMTLSKAAQRRIWAAFMAGGSYHSARAGTLTYIINRCEVEGQGYELVALPGRGYNIKPAAEV